jgi:hypothetical protein
MPDETASAGEMKDFMSTPVTGKDEPILLTGLKLIAKGKSVFPCMAGGKSPLTKHGFHDATTDTTALRLWFRKWPDANLAIPTGEQTGLVVLDIDMDLAKGKNGEASLSNLTAKYGQLPSTTEVRTPRGGRHIYFKHPGGKVASRSNHPASNLDIRADGGYILIPPSRTCHGEYSYLNHLAPVDCPDWLLELLIEGTVDTPNITVPNTMPNSVAAIHDALRFISSEDYNIWTRIGMAIHSEIPNEDGLALWDEWSKACPDKYDQKQLPKKWASFNDRSGGVTLGTLFDLAKQSGWGRSIDSETPLAYEPFPVDALPEPYRSLVVHGAVSIGCDPSLIALPLLATTAGAIGNTRRIKLKAGWTEPAILWAVTVAASGDRKSPAFDLGNDGLSQIEDRAWAEYEASEEGYKRDLQQWKDEGKEGRKPEPPTPSRTTVREISIEQLAPILSENPKGLVLARDELAAWAGGFDKYRGGKGEESAHWLEMYRAGKLTVDRKTGDRKRIHVPRAAVSITGTIQPGTLGRVLGQQHFENGLAARLLLAWPPRQLHQWTEAEVGEDVIIPVRRVFDDLNTLEMGADGFGNSVPIDLMLTPEGKRRWIAFYNDHGEEIHTLGDERLAAAWSKLEGATARFALIINCVRAAAKDPTLQDASAVDKESIEAAIKLVTWFKNETRRIYGRLAENEGTRDARKVLEFIQAKGGHATVRDFTRAGVCGGDQGRLEEILGQLGKEGKGSWVVVPTTGRGGRPTRTFKLLPHRETDKTDKTYVTEGGSVSFAVSREKETSAVNAQNEVLPVPRFRGATSETAIEEGTL